MSLAQVLGRLPSLAREAVIVGTETADDAGVVRLPDGTALVATVDFITPLVDDPRAFGAIAAANSVSDIHAMGAKPILALSVACFPSKDWPLETLAEILAGGAEKLGEAGVPVVGGHTVEDPEMKIGYAVVGLAQEASLWRNSTARTGDRLFLSKPLGTGIIAAANRKGVSLGDAWVRAVASMQALHLAVLSVIEPADVHAATDISGFGLAGHAAEMARGSNATLRIRARDLPLFPGVVELARRGFHTRALGPNRDYAAPILVASTVDAGLVDVIHDAQTSGGLLISVDPASRTASRLAARPDLATEVGVVESRSEANLIIE